MLTIEICFLAERDWYLYFMSEKKWREFALTDLDELFELILSETPNFDDYDFDNLFLRWGCDDLFQILGYAYTSEQILNSQGRQTTRELLEIGERSQNNTIA